MFARAGALGLPLMVAIFAVNRSASVRHDLTANRQRFGLADA